MFKSSTIFAVFSLLIVVLGYLNKSQIIDIQLHDSYYVLNCYIVSSLIGFWLILNGTVYFCAEKLKLVTSNISGYLNLGFLMLFILVTSPLVFGLVSNEEVLVVGLVAMVFLMFSMILFTFMIFRILFFYLKILKNFAFSEFH